VHNGLYTEKLDETLVIAASGEEIRRACEWLTTALRHHYVPERQVGSLELALHEALANVLSHGGSAAAADPIRIRLEVRERASIGEARVNVRDSGIPFDPTRAPEYTMATNLADVQPGGLGLLLIRRCSDWMSYRREGGHNHFTFGAQWPKL